MRQLSLSEARRLLPNLVDEVKRSGKSIMLTRHAKPVAILSACSTDQASSIDNELPLRGLALNISDDFDAPLTDTWKVLGS